MQGLVSGMPIVLEALHLIQKKLLPNVSRSVLFCGFMHGTHVIINGVMSISHLIDLNFCANGQETSLNLNIN